MTSHNSHKERARTNRAIAAYNMLPNLLWSALSLIPVCVFCYRYVSIQILMLFIVISLLTVFLPHSFSNKIRLGSTASTYKNIGIPFIIRFTQNGTMINAWIRTKYPEHRVISRNTKSMNRLYQQTFMFEKYHYVMFVFLLLLTILAIIKGHAGWIIFLIPANLLYNVYPILIQQYVRLKLRK